MIKKLNSYPVYYALLLILSLILANFITETEPGPDSRLYLSVAQDFKDGHGLVDNIRKDNIIPPIGHPFILVILEKLLILDIWTYLAGALSLFAFSILTQKLLNNILISIFCTCYLLYALPSFIKFNVESSLLFTCQVFLTLYIISLSSKRLFIFFATGVILASYILVRSLLLPWLIVLTICLIGHSILKKKLWKNNPLNGLIVIAASSISILLFTAAMSYAKHRDIRYVTGTYSGIPLYSAFNNYVRLTTEYWSGIWKELPPDQASEGLAPFSPTLNWQERDRLLKKEALNFIIQHPKKAWDGYVWRLRQYTTHPHDKIQALYYIWLLSLIICLYRRRTWHFSDPNFIFIATLLLQSLFVYCGERYLTALIPTYLSCIVFNIYEIKKGIKNSPLQHVD